MNILFWNINNTPESKKDVIIALIKLKQPDIFFLAESNKADLKQLLTTCKVNSFDIQCVTI